jgi:hypothetical protein
LGRVASRAPEKNKKPNFGRGKSDIALPNAGQAKKAGPRGASSPGPVTFLWYGCRIGWNRLQLEALVHERDFVSFGQA